jgi:hypothetical protein
MGPCPASHPAPSRSAFALHRLSALLRPRPHIPGYHPFREDYLAQSSSASRRSASHAGFLLLSQSGERPER